MVKAEMGDHIASHLMIKVHCATHGWVSLNNSTREQPPSSTAAFALRLISKARSLTISPSSPTINSLTFSSTASAVTKSSADIFTATATFNSLTKYTLFSFCSAYNGHATIGTPATTDSKIEFHPQ
ncbi:hypothetical protein HanRHA438_Chr14g0682051 [Helianthus annuus]|nr:hypothetical protein HanRHA438_Chr14g0682051 [Helianthus annuus]